MNIFATLGKLNAKYNLNLEYRSNTGGHLMGLWRINLHSPYTVATADTLEDIRIAFGADDVDTRLSAAQPGTFIILTYKL